MMQVRAVYCHSYLTSYVHFDLCPSPGTYQFRLGQHGVTGTNNLSELHSQTHIAIPAQDRQNSSIVAQD
jgi:hypothetical protein